MLRVGVDARELANRPAGKGQFLAQILWQWLNKSDIEPLLYVQQGQKSAVKSLFDGKLTVKEVVGKGIFWQINLARQTKQDQCQVVFAALSYLTAIFQKLPTLTVVHDLAVFFGRGIRHNKRSQWVEKISLRWSMRASAAVMTVSQSTKQDLCQLISTVQSKVQAVPLASILVQPTTALARNKRQPIILFVGTIEPRKGVDILLHAFANLPSSLKNHYKLQLIGKVGWGGQDYKQLAHSLAIQTRLIWSGYLSNQAVVEAYKEAMIVVYPSRYEGFGLPVAEALAAGTPVVTTDNSALPEAGGKAAIYVPTDDTQAFTDAIAKLLTNENLWQQHSVLGLDLAKQRNWSKVANHLSQQLLKIS